MGSFAREARRATLRPELLALVLIALVVTLPSFLRGTLMGRQGITHWYSLLAFVAHKIRMGEIPSWNSYTVSGNPGIADPATNFFYPFTVPLLLVLSVRDTINVMIVLHLVLAGFFMSRYLGTILLSRPARFIGGAVYMLSGFTAMHIFAGDTQRLMTYTWIPLLFSLVEEIAQGRQRVGGALLGGAAMAAQFFAGEPGTFVYSSLALASYAVVRLVHVHRRPASPRAPLRVALLLAGMLLFAGCIAAAQALPTLEVFLYSNRIRFDPGFAFKGSIPPLGLISLIAPRFFGDEIHSWWGETELQASEFYPHASTLYVGFFTLALVIIALVTRRDRWPVRFFALFGLAVLWLALGRFGYLYRAVVYVPVLRSFRDIENISILVPMSASVLAGFGFDGYLEAEGARGVRDRVLKILLLAVGAGAALVEVTLLSLNRAGVDLLASPQIRSAIGESAVFVLIAGAISACFLWVRSRYRVAPGWLGVAVTAFIVTDLLYFALPLVNAGTDIRPLVQEDAVTRYLAQDRSPYRVDGFYDRGVLFGAQDVEGEPSLLLARYSEYTNFVQGYDIDAYARPAGPHGVLISRGFDSPLMDLLNVKYFILSARDLRAPGLTQHSGPVEVAPGTFIYRNPRVYPRVLDSYGYRVLHNRLAILRELSRRAYDPHAFIVLERHPETPPNLSPSGIPGGRPADLSITSYDDNRVTIHAAFTRPGFLVLSDLYYPEWTASLDGRPATIYRANYLFRAVVVPAGNHEVQFIYRDRALMLGVALGILAGVCGVIAWRFDRAVRRRESG